MSKLSKANELFYNGSYKEALKEYRRVLVNNPKLRFLIEPNVIVCESEVKKNIKNKRSGKKIREVSTPNIVPKQKKLVGDDFLEFVKVKELFDYNYYKAQLGLDFSDEKQALSYYVNEGWLKDGVSCSKKYDTNSYTDLYADVKKIKKNPLLHYYDKGCREGRLFKLNSKEKNKKQRDYLLNEIFVRKPKTVVVFLSLSDEANVVEPISPLQDCDYVYFGLRKKISSDTIWKYKYLDFYIDDAELLLTFFVSNIFLVLKGYENIIWVRDSSYINSPVLLNYSSLPKSSSYDTMLFGTEASITQNDLLGYGSLEGLEFSPYNVLKPNCVIFKGSEIGYYCGLNKWWFDSVKFGLKFCLPLSGIDLSSVKVFREDLLVGKVSDSCLVSYKGQFDFSDINPKNNYDNLSKDYARSVAVVVPVFNAFEDVKSCLRALETTTYENYKVIIADDGSEKEVVKWLDEYASTRKNVDLLTTSKNLGYTFNVNRAIEYSKEDYVVLLNSDTVVFGNWLEKILAAFQAESSVGIAGPLSNAAGWQSAPYLRGDNSYPNHVTIESINHYLESLCINKYAMSDLVNGFCMCISRKVLNKIGRFDEKAFPMGYGEEDDFCLRARKAGFKNVIVTDTYVHHSKSKSFGHSRRLELATAGRKILDEKYGKAGYKLLTESIGLHPLINTVRGKLIEFYDLQHDIVKEKTVLDENVYNICVDKQLALEVERRVIVHVHLHYVDTLEFISHYLRNINFSYDLYITVNDPDQISAVKERLSLGDHVAIKISSYNNVGRDVFPFLSVMQNVYKDYDYVLHIHSKQTVHNPVFGRKWFSWLLEGLLYNSNYIHNLLYFMERNNVGVAFPPVLPELYPNYKWGMNRDLVSELLGRVGIDESVLSHKLQFSPGNMFWAKTSSLSGLFDLDILEDDFPKEPIPIDGTLAHAIERAIGFVAISNGYSIGLCVPDIKEQYLNQLKMIKDRMLPTDKLVALVLESLKAKKALSVVRYYDGEGGFYNLESRDEQFAIERMTYYFGDGGYTVSDALKIKEIIISSLLNTDVVGVPNPDIVDEMLEFCSIYADSDLEKLPFIRRRYNETIDCHSAWRILSSLELVNNALSNKVSFTTKDIHYDLVFSGGLYRILSCIDRVHLITSQKVSPYIERIFGIKVIEYVIPPRALDNETMGSTSHFPDFYESLINQLSAENLSGELFLIGGGPLGKAYCNVVKQQGGVAIDMGAIFDSWINFHTRPEHTGRTGGLDERLLLTSDNVESLTKGFVKSVKRVTKSDLPKGKFNKHVERLYKAD